jgi:SAM-dependent methyltransferase
VAPVSVNDLHEAWNTFGEKDPMWAVLTDPERAGNRWDEDEFFATGRREIAEVMGLADSLGLPSARTSALDFGCGVGRLSQALGDYFDSVTGVDIAPSMLAAAERANKKQNVTFVNNVRPDLSIFPDESFDFVYTTIVLQHMPPELSLGYTEEFARVLKPGGLTVFTVPTGPSNSVIGRLYRVLPRPVIHAYIRRRFGAIMQMHGLPMETLVPRLTELGLRIERVEPDISPGPNWRGFRYAVSKPAGPTARS